MFMEAAIARSSFAISEKDGLKSGLDDQHLSEGSHHFGISGRRLSLIIPAEKGKQKDKRNQQKSIEFNLLLESEYFTGKNI